jgi:hypothetical protein
MRRLTVMILIGSIFLWLQIIGCDGEKTKPRFVIVLMDETVSFRVDTTQFWPEVCSLTVKIVRALEAGEGFCVIGIDDHGFDTDDMRIGMTVLNDNPLAIVQQKNELIRRVRGLAPRRANRPYTDILGSLHQAANLLKGEANHRGVIAVFSDMIQTPRFPTTNEAAALSFPKGTEIYCFYVNATKEYHGTTGQEWWDRITGAWIPIFEHAGLKYKDDDGTPQFYQRGKSKYAIESIF